jgi:hypothetical protein
MLKVVQQYHQPIDDITANKSFKLRKFELDGDEWQIINDLVYVLEVQLFVYVRLMIHSGRYGQMFKKATLFFSQDTTCTIASVIPTMDKIEDLLLARSPCSLHPAIRSAMLLAQSTMNRYYSKTDLSIVYRIAMGTLFTLILHNETAHRFQVLHPGLKLQYFHHRKWRDSWIKTAGQLVRNEFDTNDKLLAEDQAVPEETTTLEDFNDFEAFVIGGTDRVHDELEEYLGLPVEKVNDPLKWWWDHCAAYPALSRMALDYLSAPGMFLGSINNSIIAYCSVSSNINRS